MSNWQHLDTEDDDYTYRAWRRDELDDLARRRFRIRHHTEGARERMSKSQKRRRRNAR